MADPDTSNVYINAARKIVVTRKVDWEMRALNVVVIFVALFAAAIFSSAGYYLVHGSATDNFCAKHGYPSSKVTWTLDKYCIKRVDQTDVVVPVEEVEKAEK